MIKIIVLMMSVSIALFGGIYDVEIRDKSKTPFKFMHIKILDAKELKYFPSDVREISALAYDDNILYALGDKGFLYHFDINISKKKIQNLSLQKVIKLKDNRYKSLKKSWRDSEGLVFFRDKLLISYEKEPRVELYRLDGSKIKTKKINKALRKKEKYKSANQGLEAVACNKKYGIVTAPESPLKGKDKKKHTLYAKNKTWKFPAKGSITALEFMSKNEIMILQRDYNYLTLQRVTVLSKLNLKTSAYEILAVMDSRDSWNIDNFEGLTKVSKKKYLMISDDNDNFFQKTLLVLFEVD